MLVMWIIDLHTAKEKQWCKLHKLYNKLKYIISELHR